MKNVASRNSKGGKGDDRTIRKWVEDMKESKALVELKTFQDVARQYFPNSNIIDLNGIMWSFTGFPSFWVGDAETCFRKQLSEAKEGIEKGQFFDLELGWV